MHIEVLSEDKSGSVVLEHVLHKCLQRHHLRHSFSIRAHRGKGRLPNDWKQQPARFASGLLDLLPAKIRAYANVFHPGELILVVVMDSDKEPADRLYNELELVLQKFGGRLPYVIGISVEETEAWLLGDPEAVIKAYPNAKKSVLEQYEQDSICGTWETLATVIVGNEAERLIRIGYPAIGQYKYEWAERISPFLNIESNHSPSFNKFMYRMDRILLRSDPIHVSSTEDRGQIDDT